jgi:adenylate kinase family enzyme
MSKIIIHISGVSGAGKTTLGNKLKDQIKDKIVVKDIDDLRRDFIKKYYGDKKFDIIDKVEYQKYIDNFVKKHSSKPLIFVGLNNMPWWHINHYYDMHSTHNFFIDLDDETIIKQKCKRLLDWATDEEEMKMLVSNNKWIKDYMNQGYKFMSRENIFKNVSKILRE